MTGAARRRVAASISMAASGFAGLGYQIVWTQLCSLWLGHEAAAVLAVVTAFFGGLALGGLALGGRIERSAQPGRWYVGCELVIALWSLLVLVLGSSFAGVLEHAVGVDPPAWWQWSLALLGTSFLFLPATLGMGATLPAMERLTGQLRPGGRSISTLYAANTFGAVVGVLASTFWLIPSLGLARTTLICVGLNLSCGALALATFPSTVRPVPQRPSPNLRRARRVLGLLTLTGLLGIGYEMLVVRVLSQVTEDTVYTFALLLAVYLVGTVAGAAGYRRWLEGRVDSDEGDDWLLSALSLACLLGTGSLWVAEGSKRAALSALGPGLWSAVAAEALLALLAFGLPTVVMGALFSHLGRTALSVGLSFGRATGFNLLAAAAAPALFGVLAVPTLGPKLSLLLVALGYLASTTRRAWSTAKVGLPGLAALGLGLLSPPLRFVDVPAGGRIVSYQEGVMAAVSVVEDQAGAARLHINNRQQEGSSATGHVDARQAWLPLLLHPAPRRALFLGLGTGVTASAAAEDPSLQVDVVELLPEVIAASTHFTSQREHGQSPGRLRIVLGDARRYVRASQDRYDVIVSDNFHPARSGTGSLYTVEHFRAVRARLANGGVFCQWLPLHQLDLMTLRSVVRSFLLAYPKGGAILASNSLETPVIGLVARQDELAFDRRDVRARLLQPAVSRLVSGLGLDDDYAVLGAFVAGPLALDRFAGDAPVNSEDHPVVAYRAPHTTYAPDSRPRERLLALLADLSLEPGELFVPADAEAWARLSAYWTARDVYLELGRDVRPSPKVEDMLAQVREPLLGVLRTSPDFRPAYDPLLNMAGALARSNAVAARALLAQLASLQPARDEAFQLLSRLNDVAPKGAVPLRAPAPD